MIITAIDIRLDNDLREMAALTRTLEGVAEAMALPPKASYRLNLAVDEFFNNAVDYGYPDGRKGKILIALRHGGDHLDLTLSDDGDAFDPFEAPAPDLSGSIDERRIGGLGIHLVRTLATSFAYRREEGRNIVRLTINIAE